MHFPLTSLCSFPWLQGQGESSFTQRLDPINPRGKPGAQQQVFEGGPGHGPMLMKGRRVFPSMYQTQLSRGKGLTACPSPQQPQIRWRPGFRNTHVVYH